MPPKRAKASPRSKLQTYLRSNDFYNGKCSGGWQNGIEYGGIKLDKSNDMLTVSGHCNLGEQWIEWKPVKGQFPLGTPKQNLWLFADGKVGTEWFP